MTVPWLDLLAVTRRFRDGTRGSVLAVDSLTLSVHRGEVVALTGPSGAGKSTTVALAAGVLLPTAGEVRFDGGAFSRLREGHRAVLRRHRLGVVLQALALIPGMTALENLLVGLLPEAMPTGAQRALAEGSLASLGIGSLARARVETLSGGERQRVALARALAFAPDLLLLDEPTAHLDEARVLTLAGLLRVHAARGGGALVATHDPRLLATGVMARTLDLRPAAANTP